MEQSKTRITTEAFEEFLATHREGLYELIEGEIVDKSLTELQGVIAVNIASVIHDYVKKHKIGRVLLEVQYQPHNDTYNYRLPDVSYRNSKDPLLERGAIQGMPDLAVEIKSPDDTNKQMRATADFYLANGCKMVWLVFPDKKLVEVHLPDGNYETYVVGDTVSGGDVLPDFSITVEEIFE
jgi:Uma2 family endonuclease